MNKAAHLLQRYVEVHNRGVRAGDFAPLADLFDEEASVEFRGFPRLVGPLRGRGAIRQAFAERPPDDELELQELHSVTELVATARYTWKLRPGDLGGSFQLRARGSSIAHLTITHGRKDPS